MALANKEHQNDSAIALIQASAFYERNFGPKLLHTSSASSLDDLYGQPESPEKPAKNFTLGNSSPGSSPSSSNSNGLVYQAAASYGLAEEGHSVITFKPEYGSFAHAGGSSLLSFEQAKRGVPRNLYPKMIGEEEEFPVWEADLHYQEQMNIKCSDLGAAETSGSHHDAAEYGSPGGGGHLAWLSDRQESKAHDEASNSKRPSTGENEHALKKQCVADPSNAGLKKTKPKPAASASASASASALKDPQSVAAKNRRERISERLKLLQELVPNGSKVDLVTMLEKAISYVKFLQLQVKVLATDDFWPAQGGKAPDLSQVREAIDAILATQRDRSSCSKKPYVGST